MPSLPMVKSHRSSVGVDEHALVHDVEVEGLARRVLEVPLDLPGLRVQGEGRVGVEGVLPRRHAAARRHPRLGLGGADEEEAEVGVVAPRYPRVAARAQVRRGVAPRRVVGVAGEGDGGRAPQLVAGVGVVAGDEAGLLGVALAAVGAGDDDAVGDDGAGVLAEALRVVVLDRPPHLLARARVEGDEGRVGPREVELVAVEGEGAGGAGARVVGQPRAVHPDDVAGHRVDGPDDVPGAGEEHDAVVHDRRRLVVAGPDRDGPRELQVADVVARDLVEGAVAVAVAGAPPVQPVAGRGVGEHGVGHRGQLVRHGLVDEARHPPPRLLAGLGGALRLGDVRRVADHHRLADGQGALAGQGAVRLEHVGHEVDVGLIAERALGPGGHGVAQVLEQLVGGLPRPGVQELDAGQRRRDHTLEADAVALAALDAVGGPAARRLIGGEGAVRVRGLRRRGGGARPGRQAGRHEQSGRRPEHGRREIRSPTRSAALDACSLRHDPQLLNDLGPRRHIARPPVPTLYHQRRGGAMFPRLDRSGLRGAIGDGYPPRLGARRPGVASRRINGGTGRSAAAGSPATRRARQSKPGTSLTHAVGPSSHLLWVSRTTVRSDRRTACSSP